MKLDSECMQKIAMLESITGAGARDCVMEEEQERAIFVVNEGEMGLAIGKDGKNIHKVENNMGMSVEYVEYSDDPSSFVANALNPADVESVRLEETGEGQVAHVEVAEDQRGAAIGKDGKNIERAKVLAERHHKVKDVVLE